MLITTPLFMSNYTFTAFARNDHATSRAMIALLQEACLILCLIIFSCFLWDWGFPVRALATAFSPAVTMTICSTHFLSKKNQVEFQWKRPSIRHLVSCCQLGISAFVGELSSAIITIIFNMLILDIAGNVGIAAYGVIANLSLVAHVYFQRTGAGRTAADQPELWAGKTGKCTKAFEMEYSFLPGSGACYSGSFLGIYRWINRDFQQ